MTEFNRNVRFRKGLRGDGWITPEYFGAKGSPSVDDSVAFQAAHDAMANVSGGKVFLGPTQYRTDQIIHMQPNVSWHGVPDATFWRNNHATRNHHDWVSGSSRIDYTLVENIIFGGLVGNTGYAIDCSAGVRVHYRNCSWNAPSYDDNLNGRILNNTGTGSDFVFERCYLRAKGDADLLLSLAASSALRLSHSTLTMPSVFTHNLVDIDQGALYANNNFFDVTAHGGSANIINLNSTGGHQLNDNLFRGAFSSGACIAATSGVLITERGSQFDVVNPYTMVGVGYLALGSELTLSNPIASSVSTSVLTCATGYRAQSFYVNSGAPSITLPNILFIGQEFVLTVANTHVGDTWTGIGITGGDGVLATSTPPGTARTYRWKAMDVKANGTPRWILLGDPSSAITLS